MELQTVDTRRVVRALGTDPGPRSSDYDLNPDAGMPPGGTAALRPASVLVPLVERDAGLNLILTRRAALLKMHPGQIAFPGGKREPGDADALATALREAREEIGLEPRQVRVIGRLPAHETVTSFAVTPFVGLVDGGYRPVADPIEVEEIFELPLAFAMDPANLQVHRRRWHGRWRHYYVIPYGPHYVWGATARILKSLADRMAAA